jgi:hypothetical protein
MVFLEARLQVIGRILPQPGKEKLIGPGYASGRASQTLPVRVFPYGYQYLSDGPFNTGYVYPVFRGIRLFQGNETGLQFSKAPLSRLERQLLREQRLQRLSTPARAAWSVL